MIFSSIEFFVFFSCVGVSLLLLNWLQKNGKISDEQVKKTEHWLLLIFSYVFYGWWDWRFCCLMFLMSYIAFLCGKKIASRQHEKLCKIIGVAAPLVILGVFKYTNFFIDSAFALFGEENSRVLNIVLPVGISFYTFQSLSYTIDVMRGTVQSQDFLSVALYISFFPQLVAGPIVKASEFLPQLQRRKCNYRKNLHDGMQIFTIGLFKKVVIADNLAIFVDDVFSKPEIFSAVSILLAVISYSIQIYMDFSAYSDMAIGSAKCLGYDFRRNFNIPYISKNLTEFWKRWHISLSSWLQEYLYIPLGGNRKGTARTYLNLIITMVLGGLWHGANMTFVIWGLLHGLALCVHKLYKRHFGFRHLSGSLQTMISIFMTYTFVCFCWIFFRAETLSKAWLVVTAIVTWQEGIVQIYSWAVVAIILLIAAELVAFLRKKKKQEQSVNGFYYILDLNNFWERTLYFVFVGLIIGLAYTGVSPFIYFQF